MSYGVCLIVRGRVSPKRGACLLSTTTVAQNRPHSTGDDRRVVRFRPRRASRDAQSGRERRTGPSIRDPEQSVVPDLAKYECCEGEEEEYRHRMLMNIIVFTVNALLIVVGVWLLGNVRGD
jgi:hypothetical protein